MTELATQELSPLILKALEEHGMTDLRVGNVYIRDSSIFRVVKIYNDKKYGVYINIETADNEEGTEWSSDTYDDGGPREDRNSIKEFKQYYYPGNHYYHVIQIPEGKSVKQFYDECMSVIEGRISIDSYRDSSSDAVNEETALIHRSSKQGLQAIQNDLEIKKRNVELLKAFVGREMERRKRELEKIKDQLYAVVAEFNKKIERIMRVVVTIELYLGVEEEIFQIQQGPVADINTPISFRQALLYMDEEIGHWKDGGLDFTNIKWFDEWLIKDNNFKRLLPEEKGVVVFRPRRTSKRYSDDWLENIIKNKENFSTYLLIRNGENLYRIYTEKIVIVPRLFPKRDEFTELLKKMEEEGEYRLKDNKQKLEDMTFEYRKRAVLMQGLIDRTEIFNPMPQRLSIFNMEATPGMVNFIYDDEATLPSGRLSFWDWVKKINKSVGEGSRILWIGKYDSKYRYDSWSDRFYKYYNEHALPDLPTTGVYEVEKFCATGIKNYRKKQWEDLQKKHPTGILTTETGEEDKKFKLLSVGKSKYRQDENGGRTGDRDVYEVEFSELKGDLTIKYKPTNDAKSSWNQYTERKNKMRFKIFADDDQLLNYDQIDLKDIDFYLTSRVDRPNYLEMMPLLEKIKTWRLEELANEKEFIRFVIQRNSDNDMTKKELVELSKRVINSVVWWKYKNKWKRPIAKDDTLALRMIEKRIASKRFTFFNTEN